MDEEIEPFHCYFCHSYDMYQGSFELVENEMRDICKECLKNKLKLGAYGFSLEEDEMLAEEVEPSLE